MVRCLHLPQNIFSNEKCLLMDLSPDAFYMVKLQVLRSKFRLWRDLASLLEQQSTDSNLALTGRKQSAILFGLDSDKRP